MTCNMLLSISISNANIPWHSQIPVRVWAGD